MVFSVGNTIRNYCRDSPLQVLYISGEEQVRKVGGGLETYSKYAGFQVGSFGCLDSRDLLKLKCG